MKNFAEHFGDPGNVLIVKFNRNSINFFTGVDTAKQGVVGRGIEAPRCSEWCK